jgi:hypothetical protein
MGDEEANSQSSAHSGIDNDVWVEDEKLQSAHAPAEAHWGPTNDIAIKPGQTGSGFASSAAATSRRPAVHPIMMGAGAASWCGEADPKESQWR